MFNAIAKLQQWWADRRPPPGPRVPFEVGCACGQVQRGYRLVGPQVLRCHACGRPVFVFPASPLPPVLGENGQLPQPSLAIPENTGQPVWFWPAVGAGSTLLVVIVVFVFIFKYLGSRPADSAPSQSVSAADVETHWSAGRRALSVGDFTRASREITEAQNLAKDHPGILSASDERRLTNQQREAELLSSWPGKPLDRLLEDMARLDVEPWDTLIRTYRGKGVFFDGRVQSEGGGNYRVDHQRPKVGQILRLDLRGFRLVDGLPLTDQPRLIFGGRLAEVRREPGGMCVVRLEPDSGVLLTDTDAASMATGEQIDDGLQSVVRRQKDWVSQP